MTASVVMSADVLETELAAGRVYCPGCDGPLSRWGFAREREVRMLDGTRSLRPRRARCGPCETTHVLLPVWSVPAPCLGGAMARKVDRRGAAAGRARGRASHDRRAAWPPAWDHRGACPWELAVFMTGGLLHGEPPIPP
jgi:hypothetical protein